MKAYELLFIVDPAIEAEAREATLKRINDAITAQGGTIDRTEEWGKRKLAYEIDDLADGDYTLIEFHAQPDTIAEIDRILRITDTLVRYLITRSEEKQAA
ncbi:MAG: 30S ribosomal protein S6 [Coriobacteriales bacterium]|jgi:small subunit ribosomal protein S6|nr:30S ribosomal protein S6 [Coriobacteriales bacterium]